MAHLPLSPRWRISAMGILVAEFVNGLSLDVLEHLAALLDHFGFNILESLWRWADSLAITPLFYAAHALSIFNLQFECLGILIYVLHGYLELLARHHRGLRLLLRLVGHLNILLCEHILLLSPVRHRLDYFISPCLLICRLRLVHR